MTESTRTRAPISTVSKLGVGLGVAALLLVGTEAWLWVRYPIDEPVYELDERMLYRPLPDARTLHVLSAGTGADPVVWSFNRHGHRGLDVAPKSAAVPRIVVYGDSFVHATVTPLHETFVVRLAAELAARGLHVETINAGVPGYGPDQSLLHCERDIAVLEPDVVVFVAAPESDYDDLTRNAIVRIDEHGAIVERVPAIDPRYAARMARWDAAGRRPLLQRAGQHLVDCALQLLRTSAVDATDGAAIDATRARAFTCAPDDPAEDDGDPAGRLAREQWRLLTHVLARFERSCREHEIEFCTVVVPPEREMRAARAPARPAHAYPLSASCVRAARQASVRCVDLCAAFLGGDLDALYLPGIDTHWSSAGQQLAARLVADELFAAGAVRAQSTPARER
ncbi:MAG: alginate O-acetyltransferase AlgX-related protein [Planctomycetota bacterium]